MSPPASVILVTAGSAGLGAATARLFAKHGFRVVVNYNTNAQRAEMLCAELGGNAVAIQANLASRTDVQRLVGETIEAAGRLDVVFSNGGWTRFADPTSLDDNAVESDWNCAFDVNVKSHLWLLQAARPHLDATRGAFITTASVAGIQGMGSSLAYSVTKAAQLHLVRGLATLVAPTIRVNSVSPGLLQTEWAGRFSEEQKEAHRQKTKLKRFATVEDVAAQVFSLAASQSITGTNIIIDAGYTL
ncbi:hypothetical protein VTK73DRAFT_2090 [Phialemonium thermophilum]|uniref:Uncharacterized protein n=1 Tax=Phialemonium thermophilum TaxID=223376 RepID=A0ABR3X5X2_9PEZI